MATFIKAGFWEQLCKPCRGYKGWLNLDQLITSLLPAPAYRVYTALLTQSGGDDPRAMQGDGGGDLSSASKGTTVEISSNANNVDYSSIGAPNSNVGTYFILTQDITLSNLDNDTTFSINLGAPVVTVLENTIGNVWFTYYAGGDYFINSNGLFINEKTFALIGTTGFTGGGNSGASIMLTNPPNMMEIIALNGDGALANTPIEIRVYN